VAADNFLLLLRVVFRSLGLLIFLMVGMLVSALFQFTRLRGSGYSRVQQAAAACWGRGFCWLFGMRVQLIGRPAPGPVLLVANHLGWTDVIVILACVPACFLSKAEVRRWPLVGWLASSVGTLFHQRGSSTSLSGVREAIKACLRKGGVVAIFPEGRTGDGVHLGPFHARLFQTAIDTGVPVQALAIRYTSSLGNTEVCFRAGESFAENFLRLLGRPARQVEVHFGEPFSSHGQRRRVLSDLARRHVAGVLAGQDP